MPAETEQIESTARAQIFHCVITRFGIGQKRPEYYETNFPLLRFVLAESLKRQTDKEFSWMLILDETCPKWVRDELLELKEGFHDLEIVFHDPWSRYTMMPDIFLILQSRVDQGTPILTSRVDHDDALSTRFNEVVRRSVRKLPSDPQFEDWAIHYPRGVGYFLGPKQALRLVKRDYSVVSMLSVFGMNFRDCYSENHTGFFLPRPGRQVLSVDSREPLWMRIIRPDSSHKAGRPSIGTNLGDSFPILRIPHSMVKTATNSKYGTLYLWPVSRRAIARTFGISPRALEDIETSDSLRLSTEQREILEMVGVNPDRFMQFNAKTAILDFWESEGQFLDDSVVTRANLKEFFYSF